MLNLFNWLFNHNSLRIKKQRFIETKMDFSDVLIKPRYSKINSRNDVSLDVEYTTKWAKKKITGTLMVANMDTTGTFDMAKECSKHKVYTAIHKHYTVEDWKTFNDSIDENIKKYVFISTGTRPVDFEKLRDIIEITGIQNICLDNANGHTIDFINHTQLLRRIYPECILITGNVATKFLALKLLNAGSDIIKIGIGPGSMCLTRQASGVGYPQFSLIMELADFVKSKKGILLSDGGVKNPGDMVKAISAGAHMVMSGSLFYGHVECNTEIVKNKSTGEKECIHYGMSSKKAMEKHYGKMEKYRAEEGKVVKVPFKGSVEETLQKIFGGIRSACTYLNCKNITELPKNARFIKVNNQTNEIYGKNTF